MESRREKFLLLLGSVLLVTGVLVEGLTRSDFGIALSLKPRQILWDSDQNLRLLELDTAPVQATIAAMGSHLSQLKGAAQAHGASVLAVSVPWRAYISEHDRAMPTRLGFRVLQDLQKTSAPDEVIRRACQIAAVPFAEVTNEFRDRGQGEKLYFDFDGHFNSFGHQLYAELLTQRLRTQIAPAHSETVRQPGSRDAP